MVLVSSKTIIQAHAVVLVTIAGYLIKNPEMITNSDIIFLMGEALRVVRDATSVINAHVNLLTFPRGLGFPRYVEPLAKPFRLLCAVALRRSCRRRHPPVHSPLPRSLG